MSFNISNRRYTGSKSKIVSWIDNIIEEHCINCSSFCDIFAGTGVVTNSLITKFNKYVINDFLYSNEVIYNAFFLKQNYNLEKICKFARKYKKLDSSKISDNYVSINYGNKYFSYEDSLQIGYIIEDIEKYKDKLNKREYYILLASLLYSLDRCANTVGHYDAFFQNKCVKRSFVFELITPVITSKDDYRDIKIYREDANLLAHKIKCDIVYIDPPYSSRQYSRFYHVLENIVKWEKPELYGTALKPAPENMSEYCASKALDAFTDLIANLKCKYIIVSYNNTYNSKSSSSRNKMELDDMLRVLQAKGKTEIFSIEHQAFNAGKTNLENHQELLFVTKVGVKDE